MKKFSAFLITAMLFATSLALAFNVLSEESFCITSSFLLKNVSSFSCVPSEYTQMKHLNRYVYNKKSDSSFVVFQYINFSIKSFNEISK